MRGIHETLKITARVAQSHRRRPAEVYVGFDVQRLRREHHPAGGMAALTVAKLADIGQLVIDLAAASGNGSASTSRLREQQGRAHRLNEPAAQMAGGGR